VEHRSEHTELYGRPSRPCAPRAKGGRESGAARSRHRHTRPRQGTHETSEVDAASQPDACAQAALSHTRFRTVKRSTRGRHNHTTCTTRSGEREGRLLEHCPRRQSCEREGVPADDKVQKPAGARPPINPACGLTLRHAERPVPPHDSRVVRTAERGRRHVQAGCTRSTMQSKRKCRQLTSYAQPNAAAVCRVEVAGCATVLWQLLPLARVPRL
jgi:hypothetical protein